jgi:transposase-like protein
MEALERDWERMVTFYQFPKEHWKHLRTTNIVESPFAGLRLRTQASKRYKKVANATAIIWKMLMVAEQRFRRLDGPEKLEQVYLGIEFKDGVQVISSGSTDLLEKKQEREEVLALA